jgi:hypothetical protein
LLLPQSFKSLSPASSRQLQILPIVTQAPVAPSS